MRAIVFVNGMVENYERLGSWLCPDDLLVGADGGTLHILALGKRPHVVVGDLDSLPDYTVAALESEGVQIERHRPDKSQTDLELAIERALREGADEILLLGALGGRLDQTLANLLILAQREWSAPIRLAEGEQVAQVVRGGEQLTLHGQIGSIVSAIPLSPQVTGITYTGMRYPLQNATLSFGSTRGISNEIAGTPATIRINSGLLLVVYHVDLIPDCGA
ncbi:MAG: thiamine diphosphokinase [Caldilineaceae bacterium]|nr:thiamine diphosphokinase [Caldilineaceae bacterium]